LIPRSRGGALWRFLLAGVLVVGFTAATTAVAGLLEFKQIAKDFGQTSAIPHADVKIPNPGQAQTILVIGSDHRAGTPFNSSHTDTMMLVRLDPKSSTINVLSVPRDLKVLLPGGTQKLNAAYSDGGPNLLIKTLKTQVFPGLVVNHILDVNFGGFSDLVDAIGCVYTDVDHRYYNNTVNTGYSSIDIEPGYQKLCGDNQADTGALAFVRFRHTDSDIVRNARQQDFIRWAKDQYGVTQLIDNKDKLLKIFGVHVETDHALHTVDGLINLFNLVAFSDVHSIKQIPFPAIQEPCAPAGPGGAQTPCYVTADSVAMNHTFTGFMTPTHAAAKSSSHKKRKQATLSTSGLTAGAAADGRNQGLSLGRIQLPVYYPRLISANSQYCTLDNSSCPVQVPSPDSYPRKYEIHGSGGGAYPSYRMTLVLNANLGQYYGIQGTSWLHPPILNSASSTRMVDGKRLSLYYNGAHLTLVAWRTPKGVYWVSNTLTDNLTNSEMLGIAGSLTRLH
jgi:LCP family protein required for cell wall assembly